jgi:hypothetical protein
MKKTFTYLKANARDLLVYLELLENQKDATGREAYMDFTLKCIERIQQGFDDLEYKNYVRAEVEDGKENRG